MAIRLAQFNVALSYSHAGKLNGLLDAENLDDRISRIASTLRLNRPDILLLAEFDHQGDEEATRTVERFVQRYCLGEDEALLGEPIDYPYSYVAESNTGRCCQTGLTHSGKPKLPADGIGFGEFLGQYNFVLLSRFPIDADQVKSWQNMAWRSMPHHHIPTNYYLPERESELPLSSKNHLLVPINVLGKQIHVLCCHPTPPVFDGDEKRNQRRNQDEIQLLIDIIDNATYLRSDQGGKGGLNDQCEFVVLGDLNNDPYDGEGEASVIHSLLSHPRLHRQVALGRQQPRSKGAFFHGISLQRQDVHRAGKSVFWTHLNGLRLDYVLPSAGLAVKDSGVFWPEKREPHRSLLEDARRRQLASVYSDHRLVWVDVDFKS
ncbi:endonuclease/exonuclease/phosphatase family protein [Thaumasiovibrio subtropicus]|uniref:endonuclease/exonuclease/phosphatase family protein n=1 Tax=Thaumasiovibrio subtropicus TaxID=1891207 RepID=UPI000B353391|nr:endonuclease/exonuclease/phosphatase family protein [Thaumasiovibrio subtropicus]